MQLLEFFRRAGPMGLGGPHVDSLGGVRAPCLSFQNEDFWIFFTLNLRL